MSHFWHPENCNIHHLIEDLLPWLLLDEPAMLNERERTGGNPMRRGSLVPTGTCPCPTPAPIAAPVPLYDASFGSLAVGTAFGGRGLQVPELDLDLVLTLTTACSWSGPRPVSRSGLSCALDAASISARSRPGTPDPWHDLPADSKWATGSKEKKGIGSSTPCYGAKGARALCISLA